MDELFDWVPPVGKTDTSMEASFKIRPIAKSLRERAYYAVRDCGPMTGEQVFKALGTKETSTRPRLTELARYGYIKDSGDRCKNEYGNNEIVWAITDKPIEQTEALI
jgi:hypothetical protein|tara:strand:+ start:444 stop:764 length:321 start_codon:yes stop_codon:yes gene_type:complete